MDGAAYTMSEFDEFVCLWRACHQQLANGTSYQDLEADDDAEWRLAIAKAKGLPEEKQRPLKFTKMLKRFVNKDGSLGPASFLFVARHCLVADENSQDHSRFCERALVKGGDENATNQYDLQKLLQLGNDGGAARLSDGLLEGIKVWVNDTLRLGDSSKLSRKQLREVNFTGLDAPDDLKRFLMGPALPEQPFLRVGDFVGNDQRQKVLDKVLDALRLPSTDGEEEKRPNLINVYAPARWNALSAFSGRLYRELKTIRTEEHDAGRAPRKVFVLPLMRCGDPDSEDASIPRRMTLSQVFGYLRHFFLGKGLEGIENAAPLSDRDDEFQVLQDIRLAMSKDPAILIFDGLYVRPHQHRTVLERLVAEDHILSLIVRLLDPPICSSGDPDVLRKVSQNKIVVLSNDELPVRPEYPPLPGCRKPENILLEDVEGEGFRDVIELHDFDNADEIDAWRDDAVISANLRSDTFFFALDSTISIFKRLWGAQAVPALRESVRDIDHETPNEPFLTSHAVEQFVEIGLQALGDPELSSEKGDQRGLIWRNLLFLVAIAPDGLRRSTILRFQRRSATLIDPDLRLFGDLDEASLEAMIDELLECAPRLIWAGGGDGFPGVDAKHHSAEFDDPEDWLLEENSKRLSQSSIHIRYPEIRECLRAQIWDNLRRDQIHVMHRLLCEDALQQQTIAFRHADVTTSRSIRTMRRLLTAFYHGLQSLPLAQNKDGKPIEELAEMTVDFEGRFTPANSVEFWKWLYLFAYRRILERPPAWNLSRHYGLDNLKLELLTMFDKPWTFYPKDQRPRPRPGPRTPGLFRHFRDAEADPGIFADFCFSLAQSAYACGETEHIKAMRNALSWLDKSKKTAGGAKEQRLALDILKRKIDADILHCSHFPAGSVGDRKGGAKSEPMAQPEEIETAFSDFLGERREAFETQITEASDSLATFVASGAQDVIALPSEPPPEEVRALLDGLRRDQFDPSHVSEFADLLYRIAEMHAVHADLAHSETALLDAGDDVGPRAATCGGPKRILDLSPPTAEGVIDRFCLSLSIFRYAEAIRMQSFWLDPTSGNFFASGHVTRQMIRVALKLETLSRHGAAFQRPNRALSLFARRMADTLSRHLFRYPRERASMMILEATILRLRSTENTRIEHLRQAEQFLGVAEETVLSLGSTVRLRLRLALERAKVNRMLARRYLQLGLEDDFRKRVELSDVDVAFLRDRADQLALTLWKTLAQLQEGRMGLLRNEASEKRGWVFNEHDRYS